jgi:hypothetical protein
MGKGGHGVIILSRIIEVNYHLLESSLRGLWRLQPRSI